jgi:hypothetical protein
MQSGEHLESRQWGSVIAIFFIFSGFVVGLLLLAGMAVWYVCCCILWVASGFIWFFRPAIAARVALFPTLAIAGLWALMLLPPYREHLEFSPIFWFYGAQLICVIIALTLVVKTIRNTSVRGVKPLAISFVLVLSAFCVDKAFVDKTEVRSLSMNWTTDGNVPWGTEPRNDNEPPVILYRKYEGGYCYDALYSDELKRKLIQGNKPVVTVEYEITRDFGKERGYNIRSVDGLVFHDGNREVRSVRSYGGYAQMGSGSGSCSH